MPSLDLTINERYRLIRKLGEGGMGEVYLAEDPVMQREVALKFIRGPLGDPESYTRLLERFQREARTLAKLSHPNIVHVYDFGEHEGRPYLVMEYLPGGSLAERMGTPMPWQGACQLAATVARALAFAHSEGVLHRDIKPSNILFTKGGEPVVSDFGLAYVLEPGSVGGDSYSDSYSYMGMGTPLGTPAYMAPEQWSGKATEQSDIYSLGVVLFQMLTGQVPYPGKTPGEVVTSTMMNPLPQPRELNANIPQDVEALVQKALARDPRQRFKSTTDFFTAISELEMIFRVTPHPLTNPNLPPILTNVDFEKAHQNKAKKPKLPKFMEPNKVNKRFFRLTFFIFSSLIFVSLFTIGILTGWIFPKNMRTATSIAPISSITSLPKPTFTITPTISPTITPPLLIVSATSLHSPTITLTNSLTSDFNVFFQSLTTCADDYAITLNVVNVGNISWESISISVTDRTENLTQTHTLDLFRNYDGCDVGTSQENLLPGESGMVTTVPGYFNYDLTGHELDITITLYSKNGSLGTSLSKTLELIP